MDIANDDALRFHQLYPTVFKFEEDFNTDVNVPWIQQNWTLTLWYSVLYVLCIKGTQHYMQSKPRFEIRPLLVIWSACLAIFSTMGAVRMLPELIDCIATHGFRYSVCSNNYIWHAPTSFWCYVFAVSKVYELGDTLFIILRKQKLIFLHWYHHITVMIYCWFSYTDLIGPARWFVGLNFTVHSVMYTYYTLRALQIKVPRQIAMFITLLQLTQMIFGFGINVYAYALVYSGQSCNQTYANFAYSFVMYLSYMVLFAHFFYVTYFQSKPVPRPVSNGKPSVHMAGDSKLD